MWVQELALETSRELYTAGYCSGRRKLLVRVLRGMPLPLIMQFDWPFGANFERGHWRVSGVSRKVWTFTCNDLEHHLSAYSSAG